MLLTSGFTSLSGTPDLNVTDLIMEEMALQDLPHTRYYQMSSTDREQVRVAAFSGFGAMPQAAEGAAIPLDTALQRYAFNAAVVDYKLGFQVSDKMQRSDAFELVPRLARGLANSAADTCRTVCANVLNRAFTSGYTFGDGIVLCANTHPTAGSTASNILGTTSALTNAALNEALYSMKLTVDHRGKLAPLTGPKALVIPPQSAKLAYQIVNSMGEYGTTDRQDNYFRSQNLIIVEEPSLTDTDSWFVIDLVANPLMCKIRVPFQVKTFVDPYTESEVAYGKMAFVVTASDWRGVFGSSGA